MNVVDYFTEKWNEKKSDRTKGQMKPFKFFIDRVEKMEKMKKWFQFKKVGDEIIFESYRETASQKLVNKQNLYNKRKLNEFINVIDKISDSNKRFLILKEFVYDDSEKKKDLDESFFHGQRQFQYYDYGFIKGNELIPLLPCSFYGHMEMFEWLLKDKSVDVNVKNSVKVTPLHFGNYMWFIFLFSYILI
jgi:hypothetical protein